MKRLFSLVLPLFLSAAAFSADTVPADSVTVLMPDSLYTAMAPLRSADGSGNQEERPSLTGGFIPPTPQAAALMRYGECPVSHSTGVPDITVPVHEIVLGNFRLPVALSYHASGFRPDDVAAPVGLGWSISAGGLISRTIMGVPDLECDSLHLSYLREKDNLINEISDSSRVNKTRLGHMLLNRLFYSSPDKIEWDTESDRYTYNFNGHSGVFRYSGEEKKLIPLNHEPIRITVVKDPGNKTDDGHFTIEDSEGNVYTFAQSEHTGVADDENHTTVTSWYLTEVFTPRGTVRFRYVPAYNNYRISRMSGMYSFGLVASSDPGSINQFGYNSSSSISTYVYKEVRLKEIEWDEGKVEFQYTADSEFLSSGDALDSPTMLDRLTGILVKAHDGTVIREITLSHRYIGGTSTDTRRMVLDRVDDSCDGTYRFTYIENQDLPSNSFVTCGTDYQGYYNGAMRESYLCGISYEAAFRAIDQYCGKHDYAAKWNQGANRDTDEEAMKSCVISSITYPTGGSALFEFEANRYTDHTHATEKERLCGGLRLKSMTINDNNGTSTQKQYRYGSVAVYAPSHEWTAYDAWHLEPTGDTESIFKRVDVVSGPILPATSGFGMTVFNYGVTEIFDDGSYNEYSYIPAEWNVQERTQKSSEAIHPSAQACSLYDEGYNTPLLQSVLKHDASGNLLYDEIYRYEGRVLKTIPTGLRLVNCTNFDFTVPKFTFLVGTDLVVVPIEYYIAPPYVYMEPTRGLVKSFRQVSKTVTDYTTGVKSTVTMSYDDALRTLRPRTVVSMCSDGLRDSTRYEYAFDLPPVSQANRDMAEYYPEAVTSVVKYHGASRVSTVRFVYDTAGPDPDRLLSSLSDNDPEEIERVTARDSAACFLPSAVVTAGCDTTLFEWDRHLHLTAVTQPGGLKTAYTYLPLTGIASVTDPRGHTTRYSYHSDGRLASVADAAGTLSSYRYSISGREGDDGVNAVTTAIYLDSGRRDSTLSVQFHDGLGRPTLSAALGVNTTGKWVYGLTTYDRMGRECRKWLPAAGSATLSQSQRMEDIAGDTEGYTVTAYDGLHRPVEVLSAGTEWHQAGKAQRTVYGSNKAGEVKLYRAPLENTSLVDAGYYAPGTLVSETALDEDSVSVTVFTDLNGRRVMERRGGTAETYRVYNDLGQLRYVLQPEYQRAGYKDRYAFEYRYDRRGNMVKKRIPGCETEQYWYDRAGRMSFMQDATLRGRGLYRFTAYDSAGRPAVQGVCRSCTRSDIPLRVRRLDNDNTGGFLATGYVLDDPGRIAGAELETVTYYDDYTNAACDVFRPIGADMTGRIPAGAAARGLATGTIAVTSDGTRLPSMILYDSRGEVSIVNTLDLHGNHVFTRTDRDNAGRPLTTLGRNRWLTTVTENSYTPGASAVASTSVRVNGTATVARRVTYDDLGRTVSVVRGGKAGAIDYTYNVRGLLTSIVSPGLEMRLHYNDGPGTARWDGMISAMTWKCPDQERRRGYLFTYNSQGWLTDAVYGENDAVTTNPNRYSERVTSYTLNGAIRRLQRHGLKDNGVYGKIDNLNITLEGNRVVAVTDDAAPLLRAGSTDFADGSDTTAEYTYNGVGALTSDANRGITLIEYDNLNHPRRVSFRDGHTVEWVYAPDGTRLRAIHTTAVEGVSVAPGMRAEPDAAHIVRRDTTDYSAGVTWGPGNRLERVEIPGGYATIGAGGVPEYHYYTADHVGNNRVVVSEDGVIEQVVHYYPFGGQYADAGLNLSAQQYKHGGKELDPAYGLDWHDFGARPYYAPLAAWLHPDALAGDYTWLSPYCYCANNPVNASDPTGNETIVYFTKLPNDSPGSQDLSALVATHSFIFVNNERYCKVIAFGPKFSNGSPLTMIEYGQDKRIALDPQGLRNRDLIKESFVIEAPKGMSQNEFDDKVVKVANSMGKDESYVYSIYPIYEDEGNCNSSTYTILDIAGADKNLLKEIENKVVTTLFTDIKCGAVGFGMRKPWTKEEREKVKRERIAEKHKKTNALKWEILMNNF